MTNPLISFEAWPKIPRFFKDVSVTEKIDGSNAAIIVRPLSAEEEEGKSIIVDSGTPGFGQRMAAGNGYLAKYLETEDGAVLVGAQSRSRLITPGKGTDNFGFAGWVFDNATALVHILGYGRHFGEWWGPGIQRGYGLKEKKFSLFNVHKYGPKIKAHWDKYGEEVPELYNQVDVVPQLAVGTLDTVDIDYILADLRKNGSKAAPGFMDPEGIVIYHSAAKQTYKAFVEDTGPKSAPTKVREVPSAEFLADLEEPVGANNGAQ